MSDIKCAARLALRSTVLLSGMALAMGFVAGPVHSTPAAERSAAATHGAGSNHPNFNNNRPNLRTRCISDNRFKVTAAAIKMWSRGDRIKGFHFKYRLVTADTAGQLQWWSNWSDTVKTSFDQGSSLSRWMTADGLGQSYGTTVSWQVEIKLKYPRSRRAAYRYKYRLPLATPKCASTSGSISSASP